jgi:hypothetical protein
MQPQGAHPVDMLADDLPVSDVALLLNAPDAPLRLVAIRVVLAALAILLVLWIVGLLPEVR